MDTTTPTESPSSALSKHRCDWRKERGATEGFMLIMMVALVAFAGLAYDAGMAFNARRDATNIAAAAARAGADTVSTDALYGQGEPWLLPRAVGVAQRTARASGAETVSAGLRGPFEIKVRVTKTHTTVFLGFIGINSFTVDGEATASVESRAT